MHTLPGKSHKRRRFVQILVGLSVAGLAGVGGVHTASATTEQSLDGDAQPGKKLVFNGSFNGTSVNKAYWNVRNNQWSDNEASCDTNRPENVKVADGYLQIHAQRERYNCNGKWRDYTSGYINTIGKESWKYGTITMRAKLPLHDGQSKGMWPAFWLMPDSGNGEIDIMENIGTGKGEQPRANFVLEALHYDYKGTHDSPEGTGHFPAGSGTSASAFHTYKMDWGPDQMVYSIDNQRVWTIGVQNLSWYASTFRKPYNIRLNLQIGSGVWAQPPDGDTNFAQKYMIDYVHVWQ